MSIFGSSPKEKIVSVDQYLQSHNVGKDAFSIRDIHDGKIQLPGDYFVDLTPWTAEEAKRAELRHRLSSRTIILWTLVIPMSVAPFWLMILLSLPAFNIKPYGEKMQAALLAALVSDFIGLYYVVTRDLFPKSNAADREKSNSVNGDQSN